MNKLFLPKRLTDILFVLLIVPLFFISACEKEEQQSEENILTDIRDGNKYAYVIIGTQTWMAENLAWLPSISDSVESSHDIPHYYVYGFSGDNVLTAKGKDNYITYGILYNWKAAQTACPDGWHLPSDQEWTILEKYLGMTEPEAIEKGWRDSGNVGMKLKSTTGWIDSGNGIDSEEFNAMAGGYFDPMGYSGMGRSTGFWTSTTNDLTDAYMRNLGNNRNGIMRWNFERIEGNYVRCLKDD